MNPHRRIPALLVVALAAAVALGCPTAGANAADAALAPTGSAVASTQHPKPRVLPGIREGSSELQCPADGLIAHSPGAQSFANGTRTPAGAMRTYFVKIEHSAALVDLTYERRALRPGRAQADPRRAVFVGLREDGTVKARFLLSGGRGPTARWVVASYSNCAGRYHG